MNPQDSPREDQKADEIPGDTTSTQQKKAKANHNDGKPNGNRTGKVKDWIFQDYRQWRDTPLKDRMMIGVNLLVAVAAVTAAIIYRRQADIMSNTLIEIQGGGQQTERLAILNRGSLSLARESLEESKRNAASTLQQMQTQSRAMQAAVEVSRDDQRAWVGPMGEVVLDKTPIGGGGFTARFSMKIRNYGRTPALYLDSKVAVHDFEGYPDDLYRGDFEGHYPTSGQRPFSCSGDTIPPGGECTLRPQEVIILGPMLTGGIGASFVTFFAHITYKDVFGRDGETRLCYRLVDNLSFDACDVYNTMH
jgi:hypothetical protein